jgi:hypothetical protein
VSLSVLRRLVVLALVPVAAMALASCGGGSSNAGGGSAGGQSLVGTFRLDPGSCSGSSTTGTYFRMITPGGTVGSGPFFQNPDSTCTDKTYTVASPGTDGGFVSGEYQPNPNPVFSSTGSALANRIITPQPFTAINFGISTDPVDPQTGTHVPSPSIVVREGSLRGQIEAWSVSWNNQYFNQGTPKPNGSRPGLTRPLSGTYDPTSHAFVLTWSSQVVGGPFNGFTGYWHLQGTFLPASKS